MRKTCKNPSQSLPYTAWGKTYPSSRTSRPGDAFDLLPHCRWMSVIDSCPLLVIRPSLLLLPVLGTVCHSAPTCHIRTLYGCFPRSPQGFPLPVFLPMTFTTTFVVPAQWQLSFSDTLIVLLTYLDPSMQLFQKLGGQLFWFTLHIIINSAPSSKRVHRVIYAAALRTSSGILISLTEFSPLIMSAAFSAIMMVGAPMLPLGTLGITDASITRRPSRPITLKHHTHDTWHTLQKPAP